MSCCNETRVQWSRYISVATEIDALFLIVDDDGIRAKAVTVKGLKVSLDTALWCQDQCI